MLAAGTASIASPPVASAGFSCSSGGVAYVVAAGDSWYAIAAATEVDVDALLAANAAELTAVLMVGDTLCLPPGATPSSACSGTRYTVAAGDSWSAIATRHGVSLAALLSTNSASAAQAIHPADSLCLPSGADRSAGRSATPAAGSRYTVVSGDSWFGIAQRAGVTMRAVTAVNDASTSTLLTPGERILLPVGADDPATAPNGWIQLGSAPVRARCWMSDTWMAARSGGRRHLGVDVMAAEGSKVYAVADGVLTDRAWAQPGKRAGNAWTLSTADGTFFFYAHMLDFAPGLKVGSRVEAGDVIGFVGETGNTDVAHLHFEIHPRGGTAINPYPFVRAVSDCSRATP